MCSDPAMLVSMTRDGVSHAHAGREGEESGALSDGGIIESGVNNNSTRGGGKPASLSFAPTPMLVHHSALRLKDIQASSSGIIFCPSLFPALITTENNQFTKYNLLSKSVWAVWATQLY